MITLKTKTRFVWIAALTVLLSFLAGYFLRGLGSHRGQADRADAGDASPPVESAQIWTCSMHPQIRLPKPGKCPICFMDLIPAAIAREDESDPRELAISERAAKLMQIETVPVERRFVEAEVRLVGKVDYDETRVSYITAWVPGRLDRLFVDYTGVPVNKGDHMVSLYSPDLLSAQEELLQAIEAVRKLRDSSVPVVREASAATVDAAREKLRLWGLTPEQIRETETRGTPLDHVTIYAPAGGIVIHKNAREGMYVQTGTRIYTIADLSTVWVLLDAYESDLPWLRYGQEVEFTTESYPGEAFKGVVSFIDPVVDRSSRTVKARVNVPNPSGRLKPGMFVRAVARASIAEGGKVMNTDLAGKWISPMHPEVVKDAPGLCDVCGMPLVRAEDLGYVSDRKANAPLVIPRTAPLLTGRRAVVYVEVPDRERPTYRGREVVLGPRAGGFYVVAEGLQEGERVVTRGSFKLDAELEIQARPSMMSPDDAGGTPDAVRAHEQPATFEAPEAFRQQLTDVVRAYLAVQAALVKDDAKAAAAGAAQGLRALERVDMALLGGTVHEEWMRHLENLRPVLSRLEQADDIETARKEFAPLSDQMAATVARFRPLEGTVYRFKCPMAFDNRGATWLQDHEDVLNPYFGDVMLECGGVIETIEAGENREGGGGEDR